MPFIFFSFTRKIQHFVRNKAIKVLISEMAFHYMILNKIVCYFRCYRGLNIYNNGLWVLPTDYRHFVYLERSVKISWKQTIWLIKKSKCGIDDDKRIRQQYFVWIKDLNTLSSYTLTMKDHLWLPFILWFCGKTFFKSPQQLFFI